MSLFSLTDINFNEPPKRESSTNNFDLNTRKYPLDLGDTDKGHYMMFNVYVNNLTDRTYPCVKIDKTKDRFTAPDNLNGVSQVVKNGLNTVGKDFPNASGALSSGIKTLNSFLGKSVDAVKQASSAVAPGTTKQIGDGVNIAKDIGKSIVGLDTGDLTGARIATKTTQLKDTIALYMPNTLAFTHAQNYPTINRGMDPFTLLATGSSLLSESGQKLSSENITGFLAGTFGNLAGNILGSGTTQAIITRNFGAVNPRTEYIYSSPVFQTHQFDFMFYPRSELEAESVLEIIRMFNFHSAPELKRGTAGQFLVPPSEFSIKFYYNGKENFNIRQIKKKCVLTSMTTDYAPNGFKTYESSDGDLTPTTGGTGMPVAIRLTLMFQELEFYEKKDFLLI